MRVRGLTCLQELWGEGTDLSPAAVWGEGEGTDLSPGALRRERVRPAREDAVFVHEQNANVVLTRILRKQQTWFCHERIHVKNYPSALTKCSGSGRY